MFLFNCSFFFRFPRNPEGKVGTALSLIQKGILKLHMDQINKNENAKVTGLQLSSTIKGTRFGKSFIHALEFSIILSNVWSRLEFSVLSNVWSWLEFSVLSNVWSWLEYKGVVCMCVSIPSEFLTIFYPLISICSFKNRTNYFLVFGSGKFVYINVSN